MNNEMFIIGDYVSGIPNKAELSNQPCALVYSENGFIISILSGDKGEPFDIPYGIVVNCTCRQKLIMSEQMIDRKHDDSLSRDVLLWSLLGPTGIMINHLPGSERYLSNVSIGKVDYHDLYEIVVEYRTPDRNKRLIVNVYENPTKFVEYFNTIKKMR